MKRLRSLPAALGLARRYQQETRAHERGYDSETWRFHMHLLTSDNTRGRTKNIIFSVDFFLPLENNPSDLTLLQLIGAAAICRRAER
jgi:hypothetical protein